MENDTKKSDIKKDESEDSLSKLGKSSEDTEDSISKYNPIFTVTNDLYDRKKNVIFADDDIHITAKEMKNNICNFFNKIPRSEITKNEVDFLRKIMKKASEARDEKIKLAKKYKWYHNVLGTAGRVLSTLSGSAGLGSLISLDKNSAAFPILLTLSVITLCSALASTIQSHLSYDSKAYDKKNTADAYNSVVTKVAQFLSTPGTDRKDVEIFTNSITLEMNVINTQEDL